MKKVFWVLIVALMGSCGGGKKNPPPLTKAQKEIVAGTVQSTSAAVRVSSKKSPVSRTSSRNYLSALKGSQEVDYTTMSAYMESKQDECVFEGDVPDSFASDGNGFKGFSSEQVSYSVAGENCPVRFGLRISMDSDERSYADFKVNTNYKVTDEEFRRMNDVVAFGFDANARITGNENSARAKITIGGDIVSTSQGTIRVDGNGDFKGSDNKGEGQLIVNFYYKDFTAQFLVAVDGNKTKAYLNGEEIDMDSDWDMDDSGDPTLSLLSGLKIVNE